MLLLCAQACQEACPGFVLEQLTSSSPFIHTVICGLIPTSTACERQGGPSASWILSSLFFQEQRKSQRSARLHAHPHPSSTEPLRSAGSSRPDCPSGSLEPWPGSGELTFWCPLAQLTVFRAPVSRGSLSLREVLEEPKHRGDPVDLRILGSYRKWKHQEVETPRMPQAWGLPDQIDQNLCFG